MGMESGLLCTNIEAFSWHFHLLLVSFWGGVKFHRISTWKIWNCLRFAFTMLKFYCKENKPILGLQWAAVPMNKNHFQNFPCGLWSHWRTSPSVKERFTHYPNCVRAFQGHVLPSFHLPYNQPHSCSSLSFIMLSLSLILGNVSLFSFSNITFLISPIMQSSLVNWTMEPWRNQLFPWLSAKLVNNENEDLWLGGVLS